MELPPRWIEIGGIKQRNPEYDDALTLTKTHLCEVCGGIIIEAYEGGKEIIRCGVDRTHVGFTRGTVERAVRERMEGMGASQEEIEESIKQYKIRRGIKNMAEKLGEKATTALQKFEGVTSLTKAQATEVIVTIWKDAPKHEVAKAAILCAQYGLNPLMQHVFLVPFKNKKTGGISWATVLGINATRLMARRSSVGRSGYSYVEDTPRIMTVEEQRRFFGQEFTDRIYAICVLKDAAGNTFRGYGFWMNADVPYGAEKGNSKHNMAFIRAEREALKKAAPAEMPSLEFDVVDEGFMEDAAKGGGLPEGTVEGEMRELTEAEASALDEAEAEAAAGAGAPTDPPPPPPPPAPTPKKTAPATKKATTSDEPMILPQQRDALTQLYQAKFNIENAADVWWDAAVVNALETATGKASPDDLTYAEAKKEITRLQKPRK